MTAPIYAALVAESGSDPLAEKREVGEAESVAMEALLPPRFWAKVNKTETCWLWTASIQRNGYGMFSIGGKKREVAHRTAYKALIGEIPEGYQLDHLCRVRNCVNPEHLEPVTQRENIRRGDSPSAQNARKNECKHGHELTPENTYVLPADGSRHCRECMREKDRRRVPRRRSTKAQRDLVAAAEALLAEVA